MRLKYGFLHLCMNCEIFRHRQEKNEGVEFPIEESDYKWRNASMDRPTQAAMTIYR